MTPKVLLFGAALFALLVMPPPAGAQDSDATCVLHVTHPESGEEAGLYVIVEGTAKIPPDHYIWVFARRVSFRFSDYWWPQNEGLVDSESGRWSVRAFLGLTEDVGHEFDVAVVTFAPEQHRLLLAYSKRAKETNDFPPIEMPAAACVPIIRTVRKTSHK